MTALLIHGGAGGDGPWRGLSDFDPQRIDTMNRLLIHIGTRLEKGTMSALEAVIEAVEWLENEPLFNAGRGSVLDEHGTVSMDASLMDGKSGRAGALIGSARIKNPIRCAEHLLQQEWPIMYYGSAADQKAEEFRCQMKDPSWFITDLRKAQWKKWKDASLRPGSTDEDDHAVLDHDIEDVGMGTVGAVALDYQGCLAAGTSTGGMTGKPSGRIGDTPIIGAGTWADHNIAISCTGVGEAFIRTCAAHTVATSYGGGGQSLDKAAQNLLDLVGPLGGRGGLIALAKDGGFVLPYQTRLMYRGWYHGGKGRVAVGPEEYELLVN